jgi:hypothetical protein
MRYQLLDWPWLLKILKNVAEQMVLNKNTKKINKNNKIINNIKSDYKKKITITITITK